MQSLLFGALFVVSAVASPTAPIAPALAPAEFRAATANDNTKLPERCATACCRCRSSLKSRGGIPGPDSAPPVVTQLFGEEGNAPSNPGPLLRVPLGTRVDLTLRNALPDTMFFARHRAAAVQEGRTRCASRRARPDI